MFPGNFSSSGRPDAEKILLLVTDGQPHDPDVALEEAYKLKKKGVHLITVGAGTEKWISKLKLFLNRLGSKPTHNQNEDFKYLSKLTHQLVGDICGSKQRQPARKFFRPILIRNKPFIHHFVTTTLTYFL